MAEKSIKQFDEKNDEQVYVSVRETLESARGKVERAVNSAMVEAYWEIGRQIVEATGERAEYGKHLLQYLSERLTAEYGKGFTERNLRQMRSFYLAFPIRHTLCAELSWSIYRRLTRIPCSGRGTLDGPPARPPDCNVLPRVPPLLAGREARAHSFRDSALRACDGCG